MAQNADYLPLSFLEKNKIILVINHDLLYSYIIIGNIRHVLI